MGAIAKQPTTGIPTRTAGSRRPNHSTNDSVNAAQSSSETAEQNVNSRRAGRRIGGHLNTARPGRAGRRPRRHDRARLSGAGAQGVAAGGR